MASFLRQDQPAAPPAWFVSLAVIGALYVAPFLFRLVAHLSLCLRRPKDMIRRYGAWAVVTGPTSGIGRSFALELASQGMNLVLVDLNAANLRKISDTIRSRHGVQTKTVVFDLSSVGASPPLKAMARLKEAIEGLDVGVLVNNAGVAKPGARYLHEADVEAWVRMVKVNLWAVTEVTAAVLPGMVERGRGAVVNMGSASSEAIPSFPLYTMYAATKRYVAQFSRSLYVEYRSKWIDVQCQAPFFVATGMVSRLSETSRLSLLLVAPAPDALRARGGALDGARPAALRAKPLPPAPVVPRRRRAGPVHDWLRLRANLRHRAVPRRVDGTSCGRADDQVKVLGTSLRKISEGTEISGNRGYRR
ncbi:hypothetical protein ACQ4PT_018874 [Festuca glaucescens]